MSIDILDYYTTTDNPIMFNDMISQRLTAYPDTKFALVQFDIKRFKLINENYGEDAGTEMLQFISRQLSNFCGKQQMGARMSGDVFTLLTPYEDKDGLLSIVSELQRCLKNFRQYSYEFVFGIYLIEDRSVSVRTMCDCAAMARQSIKKNALESVAFYNKNMQKEIKERKFVESHMKKALDNNEFIIYLQPKFSISSGEAVGYEALVRWQNPERGMIYPGGFIPLFEENGFITKLDAYVWECACMVLRDWIDRHFTPLPISVNVSRANLDDESFLDVLDGLIEKYRLPKHLLELEITESIENDTTLRMTEKIKEHGYILLMDDFGSGYSSLNTLQDTKFDVLKLDREFFSTHMSNDRGKKIIMHTISMSKDVGLGLIAEGVETADQAQFLENCGCDTAQGYLYAKPMPVQEAEKYLKNASQSKTDNEGVTP
ncbi:MAG: putative bifunctional diguanylate cyclase/phosphodiesterase [[Eubacterium] siraeum]